MVVTRTGLHLIATWTTTTLRKCDRRSPCRREKGSAPCPECLPPQSNDPAIATEDDGEGYCGDMAHDLGGDRKAIDWRYQESEVNNPRWQPKNPEHGGHLHFNFFQISCSNLIIFISNSEMEKKRRTGAILKNHEISFTTDFNDI